MIRTLLTIYITGASHTDIELKLKERLVSYFKEEYETIKEKLDIEMFIVLNETPDREADSVFGADCRVKVKS